MSGQNVARQHETHWDGADLAVEIVSDEGRERDLVTKRREYARAGIAEYWIIDPLLRQVTILRLDGDHYIEAGTYAPGDTAASVLLPGFNVAVTDIFNAR
jgi:Uma2 family endonuclease